MDATSRFVGTVARCLRSLDVGSEGVLVGVSGGADSVALARAVALAKMPLVLAHFNHCLRASESDADEAFVVELAGRLNVACGRVRRAVADEARRIGENLEASARRQRYAWLAEAAQAHGLRWVATAHTADDQAETVLHRLLRGAGLQGLRGIAPRRELVPGVELVRPLLGVTRAEVLAFLGALGQPFREDSSNRDLSRTRNRIRHELLPHLAAHYNPDVASVLGRLAEQAAEAFRDEEAIAAALLRECELPRAGELLVFDLARLAAALPRAVRALFRQVWQREGWPRDSMGFDAWRRLAALARRGKAIDLPGPIRAQRRGRALVLGRVTRTD